MPLERHDSFHVFEDSARKEFVFPMVAGKQVVFGLVSFSALRDRALRDNLSSSVTDRELFDRYRQIVEHYASIEFDAGHSEEVGVLTEVRVTSAHF